MPPKPKKGKGERKGKKKVSVPLDDIDTTVLTHAQLEEFCVNVFEALTEEKQHSDFLRLERDKLANMAAISQEQLVFVKQKNHDKQMKLDDAEEKHRLDMRKKREQLINFMSEKNIDCLNTKLVCVQNGEYERACHEQRMDTIIADVNNLKLQLVDLEKSFSETKTKVEIDLAEQKYKLRQDEKETHILIEHKWDKKLNGEVIFLSDTFKHEYERLKNRKFNETTQLIKRNNKFTHNLNQYYEKIVYPNLNLILNMKANLQDLKTEIMTVDNNLGHLRLENKKLRESIAECKEENQSLQETLSSSVKDKKVLKETRKELVRRKATLEDLKLELETLNMVVAKQDELVKKRAEDEDNALVMVKTSAEEVTLVMEYMAAHLRHKVDELVEVLNKLGSNMKCKKKGRFRIPPHPIQPAKDFVTWDLATVANQHDRILHNYQQLLAKYGVHPDNTGFTPLLAEEVLKRVDHLRIIVSEE